LDESDNFAQPQLPGVPEPAQIEAWQELSRAAWHYARASKASNTLRAYRADLADFTLWCKEHGRESLRAEPQTLSLYIADLGQHGAKLATVQRRLAAISRAHQLADVTPSPTGDWAVKATMTGIRRTHGVAPNQKAAILTPELRRLLAHVPADTLAGRRDRALRLIGFAGASRRSELVALDVDYVELRSCRRDDHGKQLSIARGRICTDQGRSFPCSHSSVASC
jgi:site-specific recombinase XerD